MTAAASFSLSSLLDHGRNKLIQEAIKLTDIHEKDLSINPGLCGYLQPCYSLKCNLQKTLMISDEDSSSLDCATNSEQSVDPNDKLSPSINQTAHKDKGHTSSSRL